MNNEKKIVSLLAVATIVGMLLVPRPSFAAGPGFFSGNFFQGFIDFISKEFNLDRTKVQSAMQSYQEQRKGTGTPRLTMSPQDRQVGEKKRFDTLVIQGKINSDQENLILAELAALRVKYPQDKNITPEQRKTNMTTMQNDLKTWAQGQGIDPNILMMFGRGGGFGGGRMGGEGHKWQKPTPTP